MGHPDVALGTRRWLGEEDGRASLDSSPYSRWDCEKDGAPGCGFGHSARAGRGRWSSFAGDPTLFAIELRKGWGTRRRGFGHSAVAWRGRRSSFARYPTLFAMGLRKGWGTRTWLWALGGGLERKTVELRSIPHPIRDGTAKRMGHPDVALGTRRWLGEEDGRALLDTPPYSRWDCEKDGAPGRGFGHSAVAWRGRRSSFAGYPTLCAMALRRGWGTRMWLWALGGGLERKTVELCSIPHPIRCGLRKGWDTRT